MKTKKELLQKLNDLNVNPYLKARAKRLSVKDLQKLVQLLVEITYLANIARRKN